MPRPRPRRSPRAPAGRRRRRRTPRRPPPRAAPPRRRARHPRPAPHPRPAQRPRPARRRRAAPTRPSSTTSWAAEMRRGSASIAANPVLIGAATVLVVVVAVFLAYYANTGQPFVPTYQLKAELPNAASLVVGNEVRVGGTRVGAVDDIQAVTDNEGRARAVITMQLERSIEPLPVDTTVLVRNRSVLGLKYVQLTKGNSSEGLQDGATIPVRQARPEPVEFDQFLSTFDDPTRRAQEQNTIEF